MILMFYAVLKVVGFVSLIRCSKSCIYQDDGTCTMVRALSAGCPADQSCIHYVPLASKQCGKRLSDIGNADQFQSLGCDQFTLDPFGDQTLGKA